MKNNRIQTYIFHLLIFLCLSFLAFKLTDDDPVQQLLGKIASFQKKYPQEKIHLHLDKPFYSIGDTIWFKAYVVNSEKNQLSAISRILFVDLIDNKNEIRQSLRFPIASGTAHGDIALTDSLTEGNYHIRAHTAWMHNFDTAWYFDKEIPIGDALTNDVLTKISYTYADDKITATIKYSTLADLPLAEKEVSYQIFQNQQTVIKGKGVTDSNGDLHIQFKQSNVALVQKITTLIKVKGKNVTKDVLITPGTNDLDIRFFPEGGDLVNNISSKVAFKAVGPNGLGVNITGYIADKNNNRLAELKTDFAGMGTFFLEPRPDNTYHAIVKLADGSNMRVALPQIKNEGFVLSVNQDEENLTVRVMASRSITGKGEILLIAQTNDVVQYLGKKKMESAYFATSLSKSRFPTGILKLTLFSTDLQPVAERLVFINNQKDKAALLVTTDKKEYAKREKINVGFRSRAGTERLPGNFSVSVISEDKVRFSEDDEITIFSNLLLSSDVKGYIEKPNYYFSSNSAEKVKHLDNLLLTQGWRRFVWKDVLGNEEFMPNYKIGLGNELSGRVLTLKDKTINGGLVSMYSGSNGFIGNTLVDNQGKFKFENLPVRRNVNLTMSAQDARGNKNVKIVLDETPVSAVNFPLTNLLENSNLVNYLKNSHNVFEQLNNSAPRKQNENPASQSTSSLKILATKNSKNLNGPGKADQVLTFVDLEDCHDALSQCLARLGRGVRFNSNGSIYSTLSGDKTTVVRTTRSRTTTTTTVTSPMLIILDGVSTDESDISRIRSIDVECVEILQPGSNTSVYGFRGTNGVIVITTKNGKLDYESYTHNAAQQKAPVTNIKQAFNAPRQFYAPVYNGPKTNRQPADLRTTVYWNPTIQTDDIGEFIVNFFNPDASGNYRIIAEGLTADGRPARQVVRYTVK